MKIEKIEKLGPDKDIIEMTKTILEQNNKILTINDYLLKIFSNPMMIVHNNPNAADR